MERATVVIEQGYLWYVVVLAAVWMWISDVQSAGLEQTQSTARLLQRLAFILQQTST
jgi:hypothetical protein